MKIKKGLNPPKKSYLGGHCRACVLEYGESTDWPSTSHVTTVESANSHSVSAVQNSSSAEPE